MMEALKASIAAGGKAGAAKRKPAKRAEKKAGTGKKVAKGAS
ncbi:MAG: hypothetical protein OEU36_23100 [Gammaproteobacteria bacterium]|nr:hypothetical protein [Gammaproteobacteria bacterium]